MSINYSNVRLFFLHYLLPLRVVVASREPFLRRFQYIVFFKFLLRTASVLFLRRFKIKTLLDLASLELVV